VVRHRLRVWVLGLLMAWSLGDGAYSGSPILSQGEPWGEVTLQQGVLLVAHPNMPDPRFQHTAILVLAHGKQGTLGLIINRPTTVQLSQVLPDLKAPNTAQHRVFFGGPVGLNELLFLVRSSAPPEQAAQVMVEVYYSGDRNTLERLLTQQKDPDALRLYAGHAGWGPGQLAAEIGQGAWWVVQGDAETVFGKHPERLWPDLIKQQPPPGLLVERDQAGAAAREGVLPR
jgi:putative transcriptional regulator